MSCCGNCACEEPIEWTGYFTAALEDLCVEENGKCKCDPCRCNNGDTARPGW